MKIGILGAGTIASTLAETMNRMKNAELYAVASRSIDKAKSFAKRHCVPKAYGSYEEMLDDPAVNLVYIATPHSHHAAHMKLCINHQKPVLCEKAFTFNAKEAEEIVTLNKKKKVYVAEAMWTRYMPSRKMIDDMIASGVVGKIHTLTANLSYNITHKERIMRPELAGGALLDVGVYTLNFALMHFGNEIERIASCAKMTDTGVDGQTTITLFYKDGRVANLTSGIYARSDRKGIFYGENGYIVVENINNPQSISAYDSEDKLIEKKKVPPQITGYEYEIEECMSQLRIGETQSESMPLEASVELMKLMDKVRACWK